MSWWEPPDTQIEDPCERGRCHTDKESGTFLPCRKHESQLEAGLTEVFEGHSFGCVCIDCNHKDGDQIAANE